MRYLWNTLSQFLLVFQRLKILKKISDLLEIIHCSLLLLHVGSDLLLQQLQSLVACSRNSFMHSGGFPVILSPSIVLRRYSVQNLALFSWRNSTWGCIKKLDWTQFFALVPFFFFLHLRKNKNQRLSGINMFPLAACVHMVYLNANPLLARRIHCFLPFVLIRANVCNNGKINV